MEAILLDHAEGLSRAGRRRPGKNPHTGSRGNITSLYRSTSSNNVPPFAFAFPPAFYPRASQTRGGIPLPQAA
jgi:hypothetical protein